MTHYDSICKQIEENAKSARAHRNLMNPKMKIDSPSVVRTLKSNKLNISGAATLALFVFSAFSIGGQMGTQRAINETLKLCNQNVGECVFKYYILMYNETGKVPPNMRSTPSPKPVVKP